MAGSLTRSWSSKLLDRPSVPDSNCDMGKDYDKSKSSERGNDDNDALG